MTRPDPVPIPAATPVPVADPGAPDFVSVVIPTWNRERTLPRAMRSVLAQTHRNLELIVADDASTDGTEALVRDWARDDPRVVYLRAERNGGASAARNLGLEAARGPLIAFQDSDDEWLLDKLARQVRAIEEPDAGGDGDGETGGDGRWGAVFGMKLIHGHDDAFVYGPGRVSTAPDPARPVTDGDLVGQLLHGNLISPQTLMVRAEAARRAGGFDARLPCNNDWEWMIRLAAGTRIRYVPEPVVVAYISPDSIHTKLRSKAISFLLILAKHEALFARDPAAWSARLFGAGRYLQKLGRHRAAAICMARAARLAPRNPRPWAGLALSRARALIG